MNPQDFSLHDITVGMSASFERTIEEKDVTAFAELSGDYNPLHVNETYAKETKFSKRVVHGMLVASFFSQLVGMHLPGKRCLYLQQTLSFKNPVFIGDTLTISGVVTSKSDSTGILSLKVLIKKGEEIAIEGEARVQIM